MFPLWLRGLRSAGRCLVIRTAHLVEELYDGPGGPAGHQSLPHVRAALPGVQGTCPGDVQVDEVYGRRELLKSEKLVN